MSITRHYTGKPREELDADAIADIRAYCSAQQWDTLQQGVGQLTCGYLTFDQLNWMFGIAGISGFPFHAFCRKYCLVEYRAWMEAGHDGVETDEHGFRLETQNA